MMAGHTALPWKTLKATDGGIPWPVLNQFADEFIALPALFSELEEAYDEAMASRDETLTFTHIYVCAIIVLAAPRLTAERRRQMAPFIIRKLIEADEAEGDSMVDILAAACGALGTDCLPAVLDALLKRENRSGAWSDLWSLLKLAAKSDDNSIRERVIEEAITLLEEAARGRGDVIDAVLPAYILAEMKYQPCRPLLKRLAAQKSFPLIRIDFDDALDLLDGKLKRDPMPELWEEPIQEWLNDFLSVEKDWQKEMAEYEDDEGFEEERERAGVRRTGNPADGEKLGFFPPQSHAKPRIGRNEPCPCGSGKKYKRCCEASGADAPTQF